MIDLNQVYEEDNLQACLLDLKKPMKGYMYQVLDHLQQ